MNTKFAELIIRENNTMPPTRSGATRRSTLCCFTRHTPFFVVVVLCLVHCCISTRVDAAHDGYNEKEEVTGTGSRHLEDMSSGNADDKSQIFHVNDVNERAVPCPEDPNQIGYKHTVDIMADQQTELERVANGEAPRKPYVFPLCNRFKFQIKQEVLQILLDEISIVCGYNGAKEELCVLDGGAVQVEISQDTMDREVKFYGITFQGFTMAAIQAHAAAAGDSRLVAFYDVEWTGFTNRSTAVHQWNPTQQERVPPMTVEIHKGLITNGNGGVLLDNIGGQLDVEDLIVTDSVTAESVIRTSKGGSTTITKLDVSDSNIRVSPQNPQLLLKLGGVASYHELYCSLYVLGRE